MSRFVANARRCLLGIACIVVWSMVATDAPSVHADDANARSESMGTLTTGWTTITASASTRKIYVSSTLGSDTNDGLSEQSPLKTIQAGQGELRAGYPDWLLLRRGDTFPVAILLRGGGKSPGEPQVVTSYGSTGNRPILKGVDIGGKYIRVIGLHLQGPGQQDLTNDGKGIDFEFKGPCEDVLLENLLIEGQNVSIDARWVNDLKIRRCVIIDSRKFGMYTSQVDGMLVEDCIWDNNGRGDNWMHTIYHSGGKNTTYRGNIISRSGYFGLKMRAHTENFRVENNLFVQNREDLVIHLDKDDLGQSLTNRNFEVVGNVFTETGHTRHQTSIIVAHAEKGLIKDNLIVHASHTEGTAIDLAPVWEVETRLIDLTIQQNTIVNYEGRAISYPVNATSAKNVLIERNILSVPNQFTVSPITRVGSSIAELVFKGNLYRSPEGPDKWFSVDGVFCNLASWKEVIGEADPITTDPRFADASRTVGKYAGTLEGEATFDAFIKGARAQCKGSWYPEYGSAGAIRYMKAGFKPTANLEAALQVGAVSGN